jgi:cell division protein FtsW (lipid II flippase)
MELSLFTLLISLAGMKPLARMKAVETVIQLGYRLILPSLLYVLNGPLPLCILYFTGFFMLAWMTRRSAVQFAAILIPSAAAALYATANSRYLMERITAFLHPYQSPGGSGYQIIGSIKAIHSAGWWGHGFATPNRRLPFIYSDSVFPYVVYCFGWIAGLAIVAAVIWFLLQIMSLLLTLKDEDVFGGQRIACRLMGYLQRGIHV